MQFSVFIPSANTVHFIPSTNTVHFIPSASTVYFIPSASTVLFIPSADTVHFIPSANTVHLNELQRPCVYAYPCYICCPDGGVNLTAAGGDGVMVLLL